LGEWNSAATVSLCVLGTLMGLGIKANERQMQTELGLKRFFGVALGKILQLETD